MTAKLILQITRYEGHDEGFEVETVADANRIMRDELNITAQFHSADGQVNFPGGWAQIVRS